MALCREDIPTSPRICQLPSIWMEIGRLAALTLGIIWILGWVDSGYVIFDRKLCSFLNGAAAGSHLITPSLLL